MVKSLEQLVEHYNNVSNLDRLKFLVKPKQTDYVSLLRWFGDDKLFKRDFHISNFKENYRLIPYSRTIFALVEQEGYETFDEYYNLNVLHDSNLHYLNNNIIALLKFNYEVYDQDNTKWKDYWNWKKNRNEKRSELEEHFGFDTKHASHCIRLMKMGVEALETGQIIVKRPDAQELLDIRNGKWTYEQVIESAEYLDNKIRNELYHTTFLPKYPNLKLAAEVIMLIQEQFWKTT